MDTEDEGLHVMLVCRIVGGRTNVVTDPAFDAAKLKKESGVNKCLVWQMPVYTIMYKYRSKRSEYGLIVEVKLYK